jgi:hypothetical protein
LIIAVVEMRVFKALSALLLASAAQAKYIVPGGRWRDTEGNLVNAHAGSIWFDKESSKFWLFGEYKVEGQEEGGGVSVYSSDDLGTWESHGLALGTLTGSSARCSELTFFS